MPRYYFDVSNSGGHHRDEFGEDLATVEEARRQAQSILLGLAREELPNGELHRVSCDVRDASDRVVYRSEIAYRETRDPAWR